MHLYVRTFHEPCSASKSKVYTCLSLLLVWILNVHYVNVYKIYMII